MKSTTGETEFHYGHLEFTNTIIRKGSRSTTTRTPRVTVQTESHYSHAVTRVMFGKVTHVKVVQLANLDQYGFKSLNQ